jgi:hypothetical protein
MVGLPVAATIVIFGVLTIPVLLCLGNTIRHAIRSLKLRKREQREGRIVYSSRIGQLLDQHQYAVASLVIGGALLVALIWTLLEKNSPPARCPASRHVGRSGAGDGGCRPWYQAAR